MSARADKVASVFWHVEGRVAVATVYTAAGAVVEAVRGDIPARIRGTKGRTEFMKGFAEGVAGKHGLEEWRCHEDPDATEDHDIREAI